MAAGLSFAAGCAADAGSPMGDDVVTPIAGLASGATCPTGSSVSYENFGREFFAAHCTHCHTAAVSGAMRQAPLDRNFDDVQMIRALAHQIDQQAGAGPTQQNQVMPPAGEGSPPTLEQRMQLAQWLACGAP